MHSNQTISPQKKGPGIGNERAPGASSAASGKDMALQNADGPVRASGSNAANAEASLFNKHYNKELKLCEGKCGNGRDFDLILSYFLQMKYPWCFVSLTKAQWHI